MNQNKNFYFFILILLIIFPFVTGYLARSFWFSEIKTFFLTNETNSTSKMDNNDKINQFQEQQTRGLGYLSGSKSLPKQTGVVKSNPEAYQSGLNFTCGGQGPEAYLMDMEGSIIHKWRLSYSEAFNKPSPKQRLKKFWRNCFLLGNGDVIAIFGGVGIIRINKNSELIWAYEDKAHHDIWRTQGSSIGGKTYYLTRTTEPVKIQYKPKTIIVDDIIKIRNEEGKKIRSFSILDSIISSNFRPLMAHTGLSSGQQKNFFTIELSIRTKDSFHTNSLEIFNSEHPFIRKILDQPSGKYALVSVRQIDSLLLISLSKNEVVWALSKLFQAQHDAKLLENGNILLFDNLGNHQFFQGNEFLGYEGSKSRILEIDPLTQQVEWTYGMGKNQDFNSQCCGLVQRLSNGNTLITSTTSSRALEVTKEGQVVWEFRSPWKAAEDTTKQAWLFKMKRLPEDFSRKWLP